MGIQPPSRIKDLSAPCATVAAENAQWANQRETADCGLFCLGNTIGDNALVANVEQRLNWFATARARLGWTSDNCLLYVTGGSAWGGIESTTTGSSNFTNGFGPFVTPAFTRAGSFNFTKSGWVIGGGSEVRLVGPWSAKFEYLYMDLGSISDTVPIPRLPFL